MTAVLMQKILASFVVLTSLYTTFVFAVHYDLTRKLSRSIFHLLPGIIFFGFGVAISILARNPDLIFKKLLLIKSGFAKGILGKTVLPYVGASIRTMSIIASLSSFIDKMWFYWLNWRIYYLIRLASVIYITIIPCNVLFKLIFVDDQTTIVNATKKLNIIGAWSGSILGVVLVLVTDLGNSKNICKTDRSVIWWAKYSVVAVLSVLYTAYLIEMYRHLTKPLKPFHHQSRKKKIWRLIFFFIGIAITVLCAYAIREFMLPRPVFDLIVVSLQAIFIIPFFGAIFTDRLLHAWRQRRLPYSITLLVVICTGLIGAGSNILILWASQETIQTVADALEVATDITTICFILVLGILGMGYLQSTKK